VPDPSPSLLEHFRTEQKRRPLHPLETSLLAVIALNLCFLPWALGGMPFWSQVVSGILSFLSLILSLVPRDYDNATSGQAPFRLHTWPKLLRFPAFWLGLALLALVLIQALNPAWTYETDGKSWWMRRIDHIDWLPTGVRAPFKIAGPWRGLILYSSVWATVCALWIGFTRRRTVQILFSVLAANGFALASIGLLQKLLGADKILWSITPPSGAAHFSTFIYRNHAGAYLNLILVLVCGTAAWYYVRGLRRLEKSNPSGIFAFAATCVASSIMVSYSRGSTLVMLIFVTTAVIGFAIHHFRSPPALRRPVVLIVLVLLFGYFAKTGWDALNSGEAWTRLTTIFTTDDASREERRLASIATSEMLGDHWKTGAGAESFRFMFPAYQQRYPQILSSGGVRMLWQNAHNDILQYPAELGIGGASILMGILGYWMLALVRSRFWRNPLAVTLVFGLGLMLVHAWGEFIFRAPAFLLLWCALWPATTLWAEFEDARA
jgi:hypothetical protein